MIVNSRTPEAKKALYDYLRMMGVGIFMSDDFQAIGRLDAQGRLVGVVGFNGYTGKTIQIHIAGAGHWVSRDFIRQVFHYPFVQLKVNYIFGMVASNNERALRFDQRMGFKIWQTIPNGFDDGVDLIVLQMKREECKWIQVDPFRKAA